MPPRRNPSSSVNRTDGGEGPQMDPAAIQARAFADIAQFMEGVRRGDIGGPVRQERAAIERLSKKKTELFKGNNDEGSEKAEDWLNDMSRVCDEIHCTPEEKLECLVSLLRSDAIRWWESIALTVPEEEKTLDFFCEEFRKNYVGEDFLEQKRMDFMHLKQRGDSVMGYKLKFVRLSHYGPELVPTPKIGAINS